MKNIYISFILIAISLTLQAQTDERVALVIGNGAYTSGTPLANPVNDAKLMESTLKGLGFTVIICTNATKAEMENCVRKFAEKLANSKVALFYFAGHGIQSGTANYLIPVDAKLNKESDLKYDAVAVNFIVDEFESYPNNTNIVILDACRDNPLRSWQASRGSIQGFKAINPTSGTIIAFATSEGATAADGTGSNGLYTSYLVKEMKKAIPIEKVFKNTRVAVENESNYKQSPQEWSKLKGDFYFVNPSENVTKQPDPTDQNIIIEEEIQRGSIKITSKLDADLYLDNVKINTISKGTVSTLKNIKVGSHILSAGNWTKTIVVENDKITDVFIELEKDALDIEMVWVKGDTFLMGNPTEQGGSKDDKPHQVILSDYQIGKYEVTQAQWKAVMGDNPSHFSGCDKCPVEKISWNDIQFFINRLNAKTGKTYRLPTEAEWEFAARGGIKSKVRKYSGANILDNVAWYDGNSNKKTHEVGSLAANELGIYDMSGNVMEWCQDWYWEYNIYSNNNPQGAPNGTRRVTRGGHWFGYPLYCNVSYRNSYVPLAKGYDLGLRLVLVP